ncbi:MAG: hypothetical protein [Circular genetic element sp.]|nr:MAG: hypothetical protein [Circular genetic element sp.]
MVLRTSGPSAKIDGVCGIAAHSFLFDGEYRGTHHITCTSALLSLFLRGLLPQGGALPLRAFRSRKHCLHPQIRRHIREFPTCATLYALSHILPIASLTTTFST